MLFLPSFQSNALHELVIHRAPNEPNSGLLFDTYSISLNMADRPLPILLKPFGNLLPARCRSENVASEMAKAVYLWTLLSSSDTNVDVQRQGISAGFGGRVEGVGRDVVAAGIG